MAGVAPGIEVLLSDSLHLLRGKRVGLRLIYDGAVGCPFDLYQGGPQKAGGLNLGSQLDTFGRDDGRDTTWPGVRAVQH